MSVEPISLLISLLLAAGIPVLLVLFYVEGLVIGKLTRPAAIFILYLLIVRPVRSNLLIIAVLCALATTLGQWTLYRGVTGESSALLGLPRKLPYVKRIVGAGDEQIGSGEMRVVNRLFDRFGGLAVCLSSVIPGARCLMTIPAGLSSYPVERFVGFSLLGNLLYMGLLVAITRGILDITTYIPWP